ncbi:FAD-dependent monooxygenase [Acuticoccus sp.]|uniref:FAD-dependent monooxygenase n=1 Tax=Acuticoccus sp. TaxID=1904378 RepID=UPI003B51809D
MGRTIAVAGGGIVGRTLAVALASQSALTVRLFAGPPPPPDPRASAVAASARRLFARLGVWPAVAAHAEPVRGMVVTDSADGDVVRPEALTFEGEVEGHPFAHVLPNETLRRALAERCATVGIEETNATATFYDEEPAGVRITLSDGSEARAEVLVAADGRSSRLRAIAGVPVLRKGYGQSSVVGTVAHELPHHGIATQHFLPSGPLALLPLPGLRSSMVWSARDDVARSLADMDPMLASLEVERAFGLALGRLSVEGPLNVHPLGAMVARSFVAGRLALVGDSAHVIHPLAGQGLNLGLRDAAALAEAIVDAARLGEDLALALPRYEVRRRADTVQMTLVTDALNAIFSRRSNALRALRSIGVAFVEERDGLKSLFMREAAGLEGDVPRLMRGEAI